MESPETSQPNLSAQPDQPLPESNSLSPIQTRDACTTSQSLPRTKTQQSGRKYAKIQALAIQSAIAETIKSNGVSPATLASLSRVWLDLEFYRSGLAGPAAVALPAANRKKSAQEPSPQKPSPEAKPENPGPEFTEEP